MASQTIPIQGGKLVDVKVSSVAAESSVGVILTHGAGGDLDSGNLPIYAEAFAGAGVPTVRMSHPRTIPGGLANMQASGLLLKFALQAVMSHADPNFPKPRSWVLAGHSMGGRIAAEAAHANQNKVIGLIFFSYPLHPPGKRDKLRDAPLQRLHQPMLFIRGTRDAFCDTDKFNAVLPSIPSSQVTVHTVEGGDHSLNVKGGKVATADARSKLIQAAVQFVLEVSAGQVPDQDQAQPAQGARAALPPRKRAKRKA